MRQVALMGVKGGPAISPGSNMPSSILVRMGGQTILVDAGLGATRGLCDQGIRLTELDLIVITHLHSDHYLELGALLHTAWVSGLRTPVPVIGPPGLEAYWAHFLTAMAFDVELRIEDEGRCPLAPLAEIHEISQGEIWNRGGVSLSALQNVHPPIDCSFALNIVADDRKVTLSGDTCRFDGMIAFAQRADLLVHEALLEVGVEALCRNLDMPDDRLKRHLMRSHTTAQDAGRVATRAGVRHLALNHFVPGADASLTPQVWEKAVRETWSGPLTLGRDGLVIDIP